MQTCIGLATAAFRCYVQHLTSVEFCGCCPLSHCCRNIWRSGCELQPILVKFISSAPPPTQRIKNRVIYIFRIIISAPDIAISSLFMCRGNCNIVCTANLNSSPICTAQAAYCLFTSFILHALCTAAVFDQPLPTVIFAT